MKKYTLTKTKNFRGLYQIKALRDIPSQGVKKGDLGGWVQSGANLSQEEDCWVFGDAWVSGSARVYDNARVYDSAWVYGSARVYGNARVSGSAQVYGNAMVAGSAVVAGSAQVSGSARVLGGYWVSSSFSTWAHDGKGPTEKEEDVKKMDAEQGEKTDGADEGVVPTEAAYKGWRRAQFVKALANAQVRHGRVRALVESLGQELSRTQGVWEGERAQAREAQKEWESKARVHELAAQKWKVRAKDLERYVEQFRWALFELQSFLVGYKRVSAALNIRWGYYEKLIADLLRLTSPSNEFSIYPAPDEGEGQ